jgi:ferredoxin
MRVVIDAERCDAMGTCVDVAPDVFTQDLDGYSTLIEERPPEGLHDAVRDAVAQCPVGAISLVEDGA